MKRTLARLVVAALATVAITSGANPMVADAAVPTCVATRSWNSGVWKWARATNNCSSSQRLYFRWDRAVDGSCITLRARGGAREEGRLFQARFAGLTNC